jgi:hypothetical protein
VQHTISYDDLVIIFATAMGGMHEIVVVGHFEFRRLGGRAARVAAQVEPVA